MDRLAPALRRLAASFLLVAAFFAVFAVGSYKQLNTHITLPGGESAQVVRKFGVEVAPVWAIPGAVAVGVFGLALAILIYRGRTD